MLLGLAGCAEPPCEDMLASERGLVVTAAEHGLAWGEPSCDSCHLRAALHTRSCTPGVDLRAVRQEVAGVPVERTLDPAVLVEACGTCHGPNGTAPRAEGAEP